MASLKIILPCSSHRFPSSHFSFPSHVRLPHIIRWSDLLDRRILTRAASRAALQLRRTMNNDCGVYRWTCVSARAAVCWQRPGSYSSSILLGLQQTMKAAGTMNTKTLKGHRRHLNSLQSHCKRTDPNKKAAFGGICASDPDLNLFFYHSFPLTSVSQSYCSTVLLFPLLRSDNKPLHSSADSSSPKATLIVLKHTAPVKLIIVLACCHFVAGPVT